MTCPLQSLAPPLIPSPSLLLCALPLFSFPPLAISLPSSSLLSPLFSSLLCHPLHSSFPAPPFPLLSPSLFQFLFSPGFVLPLISGRLGSSRRFSPLLANVFARLRACLPACSSACLVCVALLPVCLTACLPVCLAVCLYFCLSVFLSVCLPAWLSVCLFVCVSVWLSACLSGCLSVGCLRALPLPLLPLLLLLLLLLLLFSLSLSLSLSLLLLVGWFSLPSACPLMRVPTACRHRPSVRLPRPALSTCLSARLCTSALAGCLILALILRLPRQWQSGGPPICQPVPWPLRLSTQLPLPRAFFPLPPWPPCRGIPKESRNHTKLSLSFVCTYIYICRVKEWVQKLFSSFPRGVKLISVSRARGPPRPDTGHRVFVRLAGKGLTADVRLSTILPAIMLERWHHSSVSYSTQVHLGCWLEIHIQGYCTAHQGTGLTDMASCCRCTASVRRLAVIVNIGAHAPCQ